MSETKLLGEELVYDGENSSVITKTHAGDMVTCNLNSINLGRISRDELAEIGAVIEEDEGLVAGYDQVHAEPYKKAFVLKLNSGESAVVKADIPRVISDTPLFRTGVIAQDKQ